MLINDKRENDGMLPVENITNGNCFLHNNVLYVKTNMPAWIEPYEASSICVCVRLDTGKLTRLNKQIKVTPINVECNMLNQNQLKTKEDLADYIVNEKLKEKNPALKNKNVPEVIKEMFPDWETIPLGENSKYNKEFTSSLGSDIKISLYREAKDEDFKGELIFNITCDNTSILTREVSE